MAVKASLMTRREYSNGLADAQDIVNGIIPDIPGEQLSTQRAMFWKRSIVSRTKSHAHPSTGSA